MLEDGTPADPGSYDYQRAARDAIHFAALVDRFIQNLRRFLGQWPVLAQFREEAADAIDRILGA